MLSRIASHIWTISRDGQVVDKKQQASFAREFVKPGVYTATLEIMDALGKKATDTSSFVVKSTPPVPSFFIRPEELWAKPSTFVLDASATSDADVDNGVDTLSYEWKIDPAQDVQLTPL